MDKTRFLSFQTDLGKLRDAFVNASNGSEEVTSLFEELVKIYPELHLTEELLPDLVLNPKERTSTSRNAASVKQKMKDSIQSSEQFKDYSGIELILHNEETCLNTLRDLTQLREVLYAVILLNDVTQCRQRFPIFLYDVINFISRQLIYGQQRFPLFYMTSLILYQDN